MKPLLMILASLVGMAPFTCMASESRELSRCERAASDAAINSAYDAMTDAGVDLTEVHVKDIVEIEANHLYTVILEGDFAFQIEVIQRADGCSVANAPLLTNK